MMLNECMSGKTRLIGINELSRENYMELHVNNFGKNNTIQNT